MNLPVRFSGFAAAAIAALVAAGLSACAPDTSAPAFQPRLDAEPTTASSEVITVAQAVPTQTRLVFEDHACLDCHTDQARLMELALPVEQLESHSSGPG